VAALARSQGDARAGDLAGNHRTGTWLHGHSLCYVLTCIGSQIFAMPVGFKWRAINT